MYRNYLLTEYQGSENICIKRYLCVSVCVVCVCPHTEGMKYVFINMYMFMWMCIHMWE